MTLPASSKYQYKIESLLGKADIRINSNRPWDIKVHNQDLFGRIIGQGSLGLGESYMEGWWDCDQLDDFFTSYSTLTLKPM